MERKNDQTVTVLRDEIKAYQTILRSNDSTAAFAALFGLRETLESLGITKASELTSLHEQISEAELEVLETALSATNTTS